MTEIKNTTLYANLYNTISKRITGEYYSVFSKEIYLNAAYNGIEYTISSIIKELQVKPRFVVYKYPNSTLFIITYKHGNFDISLEVSKEINNKLQIKIGSYDK